MFPLGFVFAGGLYLVYQLRIVFRWFVLHFHIDTLVGVYRFVQFTNSWCLWTLIWFGFLLLLLQTRTIDTIWDRYRLFFFCDCCCLDVSLLKTCCSFCLLSEMLVCLKVWSITECFRLGGFAFVGDTRTWILIASSVILVQFFFGKTNTLSDVRRPLIRSVLCNTVERVFPRRSQISEDSDIRSLVCDSV